MDRIKMFFKAKFSTQHEKEFESVLGELNTLVENIRQLMHNSDQCAALVSFFNLISPWHDHGLSGVILNLREANWRGRYDATILKLSQLQEMFVQSGRNDCGWNRTKPGEVVTESNVYLGDVYGIWTFSIAHFRKDENAPQHPYTAPYKNVFDLISNYQAKPFVQKNGELIIETIESLNAGRYANAA